MLKRFTIGVMGGGQLGRMLAQAAQVLGMRVIVLDPQAEGPASQVADQHMQAAYDDPAALDRFAEACDAITTEFENVPALSLKQIARDKPVCPAADAVAIAQDRWCEKSFFSAQQLPTAPFALLALDGHGNTDAALQACRHVPFPAILKTRRLGYDGKGQLTVKCFENLSKAWAELGFVDCVLEERLDLQVELSVVLARGRNGQIRVYPPIENLHRHGILARSYFPSRRAKRLAPEAIERASRLAEALDYHGVLCVEFFVVGPPDDEGHWQLLANEMAPRPHNSGHVTLDACSVSQFEQQARVLAGLPLGITEPHAAACLLNLLGECWFDHDGHLCEPDWAKLLAIDGLHLHLYGKHEARIGRKMGHITICASSEALVDDSVAMALSILDRS